MGYFYLYVFRMYCIAIKHFHMKRVSIPIKTDVINRWVSSRIYPSPGSLSVHVVDLFVVSLAQQTVPGPLLRDLPVRSGSAGLQAEAVLCTQPVSQALHRGHQLVAP